MLVLADISVVTIAGLTSVHLQSPTTRFSYYKVFSLKNENALNYSEILKLFGFSVTCAVEATFITGSKSFLLESLHDLKIFTFEMLGLIEDISNGTSDSESQPSLLRRIDMLNMKSR